MATKKCKDCGNQVSTKAKQCPRCGRPIKRKNRLVRLLVLVFVLGFIAMLRFGTSNSTGQKDSSSSTDFVQAPDKRNTEPLIPKPTFNIISSSDISTGVSKRLRLQINVPKELDEKEIKQICEYLFDTDKSLGRYDAIAFFFYFPDSDPEGSYTAGKADWAPYGDWARASTPDKNNRSSYRLNISPGNPMRALFDPKDIASSIPETKRKQIFHELLVEEEKSHDSKQSSQIVAKRHKISMKIIDQVSAEGLYRGWK